MTFKYKIPVFNTIRSIGYTINREPNLKGKVCQRELSWSEWRGKHFLWVDCSQGIHSLRGKHVTWKPQGEEKQSHISAESHGFR